MSDDSVVKTVATYDTIADQYAVALNAYTPAADRELFLTYLQPHSKILDVGCAAGRDSIFFTQHGHVTTGIDMSEKLLEIARQKAPGLTFINKDIRGKSFPDSFFDAIWASAVLLHLKRKEVLPVLKNFYLLLQPGGIVYVSVKQGKGSADVAEELSNNVKRHFTYFMPDELSKVFMQAGFTVEKVFSSNEKDRAPGLRDIWWVSLIAPKGEKIL